jgi:formylglycine-generating enzyme required for sulfatase activity
MSEEKKISQEDIDSAAVKLKPIAGISPHTYIPVIYGLVLCLILFLVLFLPGLVNRGSVLDFQGAPGNCAVYIDDVFKGSTNQSLFLRSGTYKVKLEHAGFRPQEVSVKVGGRVFGTLFSASKCAVEYSLESDKPEEFLASAFSEYATWSLSGSPSALYQLPMVLSAAASDLAKAQVLQKGKLFGTSSGADSVAQPEPTSERAFGLDVLSMAASPAAARDGLRASLIVAANGRPGPLSLIASARDLSAALAGSKAGVVWLKDMLSQKSYSNYAAIVGAAKSIVPDATSVPKTVGRVTVGGVSFVQFSPGTFVVAGQAPSGSFAPYNVEVPAFGLATTEVTNAQWLRFLQENPMWRPENRDALVRQGLADNDYLSGWKGEANSLPIVEVSWFAANAYCEWLEKAAPPGYKVTLPTEAMWEAAAKAGLAMNQGGTTLSNTQAVWSSSTRTGPEPVGSLGASPSGLSDMLGNVWEWTLDAYRPYPGLAIGKFSGNEKAVRGGSWANAKDSITAYSRGGVAATHGSPYLGFRPALVRQ